jgi:hypothetical protein
LRVLPPRERRNSSHTGTSAEDAVGGAVEGDQMDLTFDALRPEYEHLRDTVNEPGGVHTWRRR